MIRAGRDRKEKKETADERERDRERGKKGNERKALVGNRYKRGLVIPSRGSNR